MLWLSSCHNLLGQMSLLHIYQRAAFCSTLLACLCCDVFAFAESQQEVASLRASQFLSFADQASGTSSTCLGTDVSYKDVSRCCYRRNPCFFHSRLLAPWFNENVRRSPGDTGISILCKRRFLYFKLPCAHTWSRVPSVMQIRISHS